MCACVRLCISVCIFACLSTCARVCVRARARRRSSFDAVNYFVLYCNNKNSMNNSIYCLSNTWFFTMF